MEIGLYWFFPGFLGPIKSTEMYVYTCGFMVHAIHTSTDVYGTHLSFPLIPTPRRGRSFHTFPFNRSSVWCWRRLWRFPLVIIPVRKAQKHWEGGVSEGDDFQVFVGEWGGKGEDIAPLQAVYVISKGFLECDCTTSFKKQHWTIYPTVDSCVA